jgi:hypothetical protein
MEILIIQLNSEGNQGTVNVNWNNVTHFEEDKDSKHRASRIFFVGGTSLLVADTTEQVAIKLRWFKEGKTNFLGDLV